jgi:hypothetical protein
MSSLYDNRDRGFRIAVAGIPDTIRGLILDLGLPEWARAS